MSDLKARANKLKSDGWDAFVQGYGNSPPKDCLPRGSWRWAAWSLGWQAAQATLKR